MPRLIIRKGDDKGKAFELHEGLNTLGRAEGNTIILSDGSISSNHAEIFVEGEHLTIRDLGSTNGTRRNSDKIMDAVLQDNDELWLGTLSLRVEIIPPKPPPRSGVRLDEIGAAVSPAPAAASSGFHKAPDTKRQWPPAIVFVIAGLAVVLLILLALVAKKMMGR